MEWDKERQYDLKFCLFCFCFVLFLYFVFFYFVFFLIIIFFFFFCFLFFCFLFFVGGGGGNNNTASAHLPISLLNCDNMDFSVVTFLHLNNTNTMSIVVAWVVQFLDFRERFMSLYVLQISTTMTMIAFKSQFAINSKLLMVLLSTINSLILHNYVSVVYT